MVLMGVYAVLDPSRKSIGGVVAGGVIYQLFRVRIV
jgi:hypothetical protein